MAKGYQFRAPRPAAEPGRPRRRARLRRLRPPANDNIPTLAFRLAYAAIGLAALAAVAGLGWLALG